MWVSDMSEMYPHTMTAWRPSKDGRETVWKRVEAIQCRFDMERTITASTSGDDASWVASILIPSTSQTSPLLRGDKVAFGNHEDEEPIAGSMKVTRCDPVSLDASSPNHWEAEAK